MSDEKVWRGWAWWSPMSNAWHGYAPSGSGDAWKKVVVLLAADYDALQARVAELERDLQNARDNIQRQLESAIANKRKLGDIGRLESNAITQRERIATLEVELSKALNDRDYWHRMCGEHDALHDKRNAELAEKTAECERLKKACEEYTVLAKEASEQLRVSTEAVNEVREECERLRGVLRQDCDRHGHLSRCVKNDEGEWVPSDDDTCSRCGDTLRAQAAQGKE